MKTSPLRIAIGLVAALSVTAFVLNLVVLRPRLWPAGAGLVLSGGSLMASLAEPSPLSVAALPDPRAALGQPVVVHAVRPGGAAARAGLSEGDHVEALEDATGHRVDFGPSLPTDPEGALDIWRQMYRLSPTGPLTVVVGEAGGTRAVVVERTPVWSLGAETLGVWLAEYHLGPLAKQFAYTFAALLVVALGARGLTAGLLVLAFLLMGVTDAGPLLGADLGLPLAGPALVAFIWLALPLAFPVIGLAILHLPQRAAWLERHRWVLPALWIVPVPLAAMGLLAAAFLLGAGAESPVAWLAARPWAFGAVFGLGLLTNIALVAEGVHRYRINPDLAERRRIEVMIVTAVPGVAAYTILTAPPLVGALAGTAVRWPWPMALGLQLVVLMSAVGLGWAVAVRRALSPRTVLRQSLQYALARRTLAVVATLPGVLLAVSLIRQRDQPLGAIIGGRPLFYLTAIALLVAGLRYRDRAQRWLDRRFFRTEYDAREILLALSSRVPAEPDPRVLVQRVLEDIASALHPEWTAVLADNGAGAYVLVRAVGRPPASVPGDSGLVQLLRWSDTPFEVWLNDERSPAARLPAPDRAWLVEAGVALVVPVLAGTGTDRPLVGFLALGAKKSEEPFSAEDRRLLAGIASQMGLAADLWRLRQRVAATPAGGTASTPTIAPGPGSASGIDVGSTIDGKYRVDALLGRGGMGAVYRARDLRLDRDVAIKVVRGELVASPEARERFRREAQMAARLHHPGIVTVFDYGTLPQGAAYLVMEFVRGRDLRARLRRGPLPPDEGVRLLASIADAVAAAHAEHVLHRDLKPENVLLSEPADVPKVLDFGVARMMASGEDLGGTLTSAGTIVGTPAYMAPEQIRGGPVDARADVYSLGVMGFEMLMGRLPFGAGSFVDVAVRQADRVQTPDMAELPPAIAAVLSRAMAYTPDGRPPTAAALAVDLRRALDEGGRGAV